MEGDGRRCGRCGKLKPLDEFAWRRKGKGQRHNYCRPCHAEYHREHYLANRRKYIDMAKKRAQEVAQERYTFLIEYFRSNPCTDCGESDPVVLEFDHLGQEVQHRERNPGPQLGEPACRDREVRSRLRKLPPSPDR